MSPAQPSPGVVKALIRATFNAAASISTTLRCSSGTTVGHGQWNSPGSHRVIHPYSMSAAARVPPRCPPRSGLARPAASWASTSPSSFSSVPAPRRGNADSNNVEFAEGDMTRLDVADNSMDVVVCVLGLYFAQDQPSAVAELWRVVKPGGTLAVTTWGRRALEPANTMYLEAVAAERPDLTLAPRHNLRAP